MVSGFLGTVNYLAPEMYLNKEYNAMAVDIFALGVLLFAITNGCFPFRSTYILNSKDSEQYIMMKEGNSASYWSFVESNGIFVAQNFKILFEQMFAFVPSMRPTIQDVKYSFSLIQ